MRPDRITANLPSRSFAATIAFFARLGFGIAYEGKDWLILSRGTMEIEFFPYPDLIPTDSWFSACIRVDDLDGLWSAWTDIGLPQDDKSIPRITGVVQMPDVPRMFALIDPDGSLLRCLDNKDAKP